MRTPIFYLLLSLAFFQTIVVNAEQDQVDLYANNDIGMPGDTISIEIAVNGFTDILSAQASINWNPELLQFINVGDFGIKDFGQSNFGTTTANQGHVRFLWEPNDGLAYSTIDSTILFSIRLKIITDDPQKVPISFTDTVSGPAFAIEFANENYKILTVNTHEGSISVYSKLSDLLNIESTANSSCDEKTPNGSLKADVAGDTLSYTFRWFRGDTVSSTPDFIGYKYDSIPTGKYTLQVIDQLGEIFADSVAAMVANESNQKDIITIDSIVSRTNCSEEKEKQTGYLEIKINDSQPADTYNISWWKGKFEDGQELADFRDSYVAENLYKGNYEVAVENIANGCKTYLIDSIQEDLPEIQLTMSSTDNNYCKNGANGYATVLLSDAENFNPAYYWFNENDAIDTAQARFKGQVYENITFGKYTAWVIDLDSECFNTGDVVVEQNVIYDEAIITQKNDTLFANNDQANWSRNDVLLQHTGAYFVPNKPGYYAITISNEYGCISDSESLFYGVTGLEDTNLEINFYPNPFRDLIRIVAHQDLLDFVYFFNVNGKLISEHNHIKNKFIDIDLSGSPQGIYLVKIGSGGATVSRKVVKIGSK